MLHKMLDGLRDDYASSGDLWALMLGFIDMYVNNNVKGL